MENGLPGKNILGAFFGMTSVINIREIKETDAGAIVELSGQLGYQIDEQLVIQQISAILSDKNHFAFMATENEQVIGFIHGILAIRLSSPPFLEITGLIVKEQFRKKKVGRRLVSHLETFCAGDFQKTRVRCNVMRNDAHKFYKSLGYFEKKEQKVFERKR